MRKYCYKSFACTACGAMLFLTGLVVFDSSNVSYGRSCPDILTYLINESDNESSSSFPEDVPESEATLENVEETFGDDSYLPEELNDDVANASDDLSNGVFDSGRFDFDQTEDLGNAEETPVEEQFLEDKLDEELSSSLADETSEYDLDDGESFDSDLSFATNDAERADNDLEVRLFSDDLSDDSTYEAEEFSPDVDSFRENDAIIEEEIDSLINQVESVSTELSEALQEADEANLESGAADDDSQEDSSVGIRTSLDEISREEEISLEDLAIDDNLQEDLGVESQLSIEEISQAEENNGVLTTENPLESATEEGDNKSDDNVNVENETEKSVSVVGENDIVALPKESEESLYEADIRTDDDKRNDVEIDPFFEESALKDELVDASDRSTSDDAENLLVEDSLIEVSLNPNALEIEEINKEYGWEALETKVEVVSNDSFIGFDSNVHSRKIPENRLNKQYAEQVVGALTNEYWIVGSNGYDYYFWKFENNAWRNCSSDEFFSTDDPQRTTIIWAHGYQTDMASASQGGAYLNSLLKKAHQSSNQNKPYRLIVWKWESERNMARIRVDAKNKTALANCSGVSLGKFIGKFNSSDDVCLIGFSFGAQVVGSALQYLATYPNDYWRNDVQQTQNEGVAHSGSRKNAKFGSVSLMLISAACDTSVFNRGGAYSFGATIPTNVTNVFNPYDYALHYYPFVSNVRSESLGVQTVSADIFPNTGGNVVNIDVSESVGRKHSFVDEIGCIPIETLATFFF